MRLRRTTKIALYIPVEFINEDECKGLKKGGTLNVVRPEVELVVTAAEIPEKITIDLAGLDFGDNMTASTVTFPAGSKPSITDRDFVIATIAQPSGISASDEDEEGEEATSENLSRRLDDMMADAGVSQSTINSLGQGLQNLSTSVTQMGDLSNAAAASNEYATAFKAVTDKNWQSIGNYSGINKTLGGFLGQVGRFGKLMPDLRWDVQEMIQEGDKVVVRSRATGTPKGPLFGVDGKGKGFDILTIDIHTIDNGKIIESYHLEDWAGAIRQLKAQ